jgi:hypothetical protein
MLLTLIFIYAVVLTVYLLYKQRAASKQTELETIWHNISSATSPSAKDLKAIARIAKARQSEIPWYERSVSTIGIVAFFSMIIATSVQTLNSVKAEVESIRLRQEIKELEAQRVAWKKNVKGLAEVIVHKKSNGGKLEKTEEDILRQRLTQIEESESPTKEETAEKLKIYLALGRNEEASLLVDTSSLLDGEATPETLLLLAEASFLEGSSGRAKSLLKKFEQSGLSRQPQEWQLRYFVLSATLSPDPRLFRNEVAALRHVAVSEAEEWLMEQANDMRDRARQHRSRLGANGADQ